MTFWVRLSSKYTPSRHIIKTDAAQPSSTKSQFQREKKVPERATQGA